MDKRLEAVGRLLDIMDELREKCPWDRKQTFDSLRMNTIEETYELADAILDHNLNEIRKELGDLLLHVVFYSKMGSEQQAFDLGDVANGICDKLVFRHPHVFGDTQADNAEQVKQNWEDIKLKEKAQAHEKKRVLSGVPRSLPAMVKAYRIGEKAASAGFDWEKREDVWAKVKDIAIKELSGKDLYVVDAFCGANKDTRMAVRFIVEVAWQAHFIKNMFIAPTEEELKNFKPDFIVLTLFLKIIS